MRNLFLSLIFFGIAVYIGGVLFDRFSAVEPESSPSGPVSQVDVEAAVKRLHYPAQLTLEHRDGRRLEVTLIGRTSAEVQFRREGDGRMFKYPIADLAGWSRDQVLGYPVTQFAPEVSVGSSQVESLHVQNLRRRIVEIDAECDRIEALYRSTSSTVERRTLMRKYEKLRDERQGHEDDIAMR